MIKTTKDGRTIKTGQHYTKFRITMYVQMANCSKCGRMTSLNAEPLCDWSFHVHHKNGRGLGGGKRDDTSESCEGLCGACHRKHHGQ